MAVLHRKEEKIQAVLGRLPKKYTSEQFVEMFIKLYSKDWGKIKSAYIKQSQDKEPGTVINMPKPEVYLKQVLTNYLQQVDAHEVKEEPAKAAPAEEVKKVKAPVKKKSATEEEVVAKPKKAKAAVKKQDEVIEETPAEVKKTKVATKKTTAAKEVEAKPKAAAKKPATKK